MNKSLVFPNPTNDLDALQFLPFMHKTSKTMKDGNLRFAKMIQLTKQKMDDTVYHTINGIATIDMNLVLGDILDKCPQITHIDPTQSVAHNGQWKVYARTQDSDVVREWLETELPMVVAGIPSPQLFAKVPMSIRKEWKVDSEDDRKLSEQMESVVLDLDSFLLLVKGKQQTTQQQQSGRVTNAWTKPLQKAHSDLSSDAIKRLQKMVTDQQMIEANERSRM